MQYIRRYKTRLWTKTKEEKASHVKVDFMNFFGKSKWMSWRLNYDVAVDPCEMLSVNFFIVLSIKHWDQFWFYQSWAASSKETVKTVWKEQEQRHCTTKKWTGLTVCQTSGEFDCVPGCGLNDGGADDNAESLSLPDKSFCMQRENRNENETKEEKIRNENEVK